MNLGKEYYTYCVYKKRRSIFVRRDCYLGYHINYGHYFVIRPLLYRPIKRYLLIHNYLGRENNQQKNA